MRVNLMLDTEMRSASPVSLTMIIRTAAGTLIVLFLLLVLSLFTSFRALQNNVTYTGQAWKQTEPKYLAAVQLRSSLTQKIATLREIQGWRNTRITWGGQFETLETVIPPMVQLTEVIITQDLLLMSNNIPARVFELRLAGRTGAVGSEASVSEIREALVSQPPFDEMIETASIPPGSFRQDPVNRSDRAFEIVCKYRPKLFE
jgi:Tfp pilus assembly protein PilN